jgi:hypothetical protein
VSFSKAKGPFHYTTPSPSSDREFVHVDPSWLCSGNDGPLPPYAWHSQTDATAAGQQNTFIVEDQAQAGHDQHHTSHNSHSLQQTTPNEQPGRRDAPPTQRRAADGVYRCSECQLVFPKRHLLKYVDPFHYETDIALIRYQADTSGLTPLSTSVRTTAVGSASVRSATSSDTSSQSTPQRHRSPMTYFVRTRDASMRKEEVESARGKTIWPDTSARSMKEARRFLMPRALPVVNISCEVCPSFVTFIVVETILLARIGE